jgi:photosystem II stability/assembly factor-like uncharacterized protein
MSDFESRIATLLNEHVDSELGPQRAAPPLRIDEHTWRRRGDRARRWIAPLAAACLIAAVLAVVLVVRHHADPRVPPAVRHGHWQRIDLPDGRSLYGEPKVGLSDGQHGWILGSVYRPHRPAGTVIWTTGDAGRSWSEHTALPGTGNVVAVTFGDASHGWLLRNRRSTSDIYATADGGNTWTLEASFGGNLYGIVSADSTHAWVYGPNELAATTDGHTWHRLPMPAESISGRVQFVDAVHGWVVGSPGGVFATSDGGQTWQRRPNPGGRRLGAIIDFVSPSAGWAVTPHRAFMTTDGGHTWQVRLGRRHSYFTQASFSDPAHGWVLGALDSPAALRTSDAGRTWTRDDPPFGAVLHAATRSCLTIAVTSTHAFRYAGCG